MTRSTASNCSIRTRTTRTRDAWPRRDSAGISARNLAEDPHLAIVALGAGMERHRHCDHGRLERKTARGWRRLHELGESVENGARHARDRTGAHTRAADHETDDRCGLD